MINTTSKNVLAKVLATENIIVRHDAKAKTASFDLHRRVLTLPVWKSMTSSLFDMLIGHEVGHALHTPGMNPDTFKEYVLAIGSNFDLALMVWNTVEDARIERMIKNDYPGLRRDFYHGYREIYDMDLFEIKNKNMNDLPFIDRLNLHFKIGPILHNDIEFSAEEMVFVDRCETAVTHEDVTILSKDIYEFMHKEIEKSEQNEEKAPININFDGDGDDQEGNNQIQVEMSESQGDQGGKEGQEEAESVGSGSPEHNSSPIKPGETIKALKRNLEEKTSDRGGTIITTIPKPDLNKIIVDHKTLYNRIDDKVLQFHCGSSIDRFVDVNTRLIDIVNRIKADSLRSVTTMINQFNRKKAADEARKSRIAKTGKLNMDKLHQYKINDDIFLSRLITKSGKNHGFIIYIDWSGSMSHIAHDVILQLFQIAIFCRKAKIPFEVYTFTNCMFNDRGWEKQFQKSDEFSFEVGDFCMLNILSSRMSNIEFDHAMKVMTWVSLCHSGHKIKKYGMMGYMPSCPREFHMSSTPLNQTLVCALDMVPEFRKKYNLQIVNTVFMTDGEGDSVSYESDCYENRKNYVLYDNKTGQSFNYDAYTYEITSVLSRVLKARTGCNTIRFHLDTIRKAENANHNVFTGNETEEQKQVMQKLYDAEGFFCATNKNGFDELFVVKANTEIDINDNDDQILESKKGNFTALKTAFLKMNDRKMTSRVFLNRFIDLISV